jgi:peroxiredoxin
MKASLLCAAAAIALMLAAAPRLSAEPIKPVPAPAWKLKDVNGNVVSSDQFGGKVVVLDFWATWCPPCRAEIPGYVELQKKYAADGLVFIGVSVDEDGPKRQAVVKKFIADHGINYSILFADEGVVTAFGGVDAIPTTFIIDRDGRLRNKKVGAEATPDYEKEILAVLKPAS